MVTLSELQEKIERELKLRTFPVGVKLLRKASEAPPDIQGVPNKATVCQLSTLARLHGLTCMAKPEDIACGRGAASLGFRKLDADKTLKEDAYVHFVDEEAAKRALEQIFRLPPESYEAVITGPLGDMPMKPDVVLIAGNSGQMLKIIEAAAWHDGERLTFSSLGVQGICGDAIAQSILSGKITVALPCWGARRVGGYLDEELVAAIPFKEVGRCLEGLVCLRKTGHPYPLPPQLVFPPPAPSHIKLRPGEP
ncbi:MAG: DUF169 domain-containing protein [Candidatus Geothermarchaeales archaeon]